MCLRHNIIFINLLSFSRAFEMAPLIGAIDEGTSSARFIVFEAGTGQVLALHQQELSKHCPQEGWVEQDPEEILNAVRLCIERAVEQLETVGYKRTDIVSIGVTNQRESTIVWDSLTGRPLHNSIVWLDMRTSSTVDQLLDTVPNNTRNKNYLKPLCGLPLSPYFSAVKLCWLRDNVPAVSKAIRDGRCLFGTVDTWLIWNLTGGVQGGAHVTDVTNASRTMLMNLETLKWDDMLLKFFHLPASVLPTIRSSAEVYGQIADGDSPLNGVPIAGCLGDQQAALVGQHCFGQGEAKSTYGTGCFLLYNTGTVPVHSSHGLLTTVAYQMGPNEPPVYALEGSVAVAGAAVSWLRDNLKLLPNYSEVESLANQAEDIMIDGGDVCFVPAFSGLYAPYWQQDARGVICGLTDDTKPGHIVKATLEAVCFQVRDVLEAMNKDYGSKLTELRVDGGMTSNSSLMQMQADLTGVCVTKPSMAESTALGAAIAAGVAVGAWKLGRTNAAERAHVWQPQMKENERDVRYSRWKMAIERAMGWDV